jgi:hypothetical protein
VRFISKLHTRYGTKQNTFQLFLYHDNSGSEPDNYRCYPLFKSFYVFFVWNLLGWVTKIINPINFATAFFSACISPIFQGLKSNHQSLAFASPIDLMVLSNITCDFIRRNHPRFINFPFCNSLKIMIDVS